MSSFKATDEISTTVLLTYSLIQGFVIIYQLKNTSIKPNFPPLQKANTPQIKFQECESLFKRVCETQAENSILNKALADERSPPAAVQVLKPAGSADRIYK